MYNLLVAHLVVSSLLVLVVLLLNCFMCVTLQTRYKWALMLPHLSFFWVPPKCKYIFYLSIAVLRLVWLFNAFKKRKPNSFLFLLPLWRTLNIFNRKAKLQYPLEVAPWKQFKKRKFNHHRCQCFFLLYILYDLWVYGLSLWVSWEPGCGLCWWDVQ